MESLEIVGKKEEVISWLIIKILQRTIVVKVELDC